MQSEIELPVSAQTKVHNAQRKLHALNQKKTLAVMGGSSSDDIKKIDDEIAAATKALEEAEEEARLPSQASAA